MKTLQTLAILVLIGCGGSAAETSDPGQPTGGGRTMSDPLVAPAGGADGGAEMPEAAVVTTRPAPACNLFDDSTPTGSCMHAAKVFVGKCEWSCAGPICTDVQEGPYREGNDCTDGVGCAAGYICLRAGGTTSGPGVCHQLCDPTHECHGVQDVYCSHPTLPCGETAPSLGVCIHPPGS